MMSVERSKHVESGKEINIFKEISASGWLFDRNLISLFVFMKITGTTSVFNTKPANDYYSFTS
jgi:hypothetical protein